MAGCRRWNDTRRWWSSRARVDEWKTRLDLSTRFQNSRLIRQNPDTFHVGISLNQRWCARHPPGIFHSLTKHYKNGISWHRSTTVPEQTLAVLSLPLPSKHWAEFEGKFTRWTLVGARLASRPPSCQLQRLCISPLESLATFIDYASYEDVIIHFCIYNCN